MSVLSDQACLEIITKKKYFLRQPEPAPVQPQGGPSPGAPPAGVLEKIPNCGVGKRTQKYKRPVCLWNLIWFFDTVLSSASKKIPQ